jgi:hypothetical protein
MEEKSKKIITSGTGAVNQTTLNNTGHCFDSRKCFLNIFISSF